MNSPGRLAKLLNIQAGEGRPLGLLCSQYFFLGLSYVFTNTVAFALFLKEFGQQNLSYAYIGMGVIVAAVAGAYLALSRFLPLSRLLVVNLAALTLGTLGFYLGIGWLQARWLIFGLPGWYMTVTNLGNIATWNLTGLIFDVRQGKRLFGLVSAARWLAFTIGGLLTPLLLTFVGTIDLLLSATCFMGVAIGFQFYTIRAYRPQLELLAAEKTKAAAKVEKVLPLWKVKLALLVQAVFFLFTIAYTFTDLIFNNRAAVQFPDTGELASFLGIFSAGIGIITLAVNLFVVSRVLARFGLRVGLLFVPVGTTFLLLILAFAGTFNAALLILFSISILTQLLFRVGHYSLQTASLQIASQALPPNQRIMAQTLAEGIVEPVAYLLSGLFVLLLTSVAGLGVVGLSYVFIFFGLLWVLVAVLLIRQYPVALRELLTKRRVKEFLVDLSDRAGLSVVLQGLENPFPEAVIYSLSLLEQFSYEGLEGQAIKLLSHPSPEVRKEVLKLLERQNFTAALEEVRQRLEIEPLPALREAALRTLAALGREAVTEQIRACLDDPQPEVRRGAMVSLLHYGDTAARQEVARTVRILAASPDPAERILAAQALAEADSAGDVQTLQTLLTDPEPEVVKVALLAAGQAGQVELWPPLIKALDNLKLRPTAVRALIAGGEAALPQISAALEQPEQSREILIKLIRVCRRLPYQKAIALLQDRLDFPDPAVRSQVLQFLKDCGYRPGGPALAQVQQQIKAEVEQAARSFAILNKLDNRPEAALLVANLKAYHHEVEERLFLLLSFIYETRALEQVRITLKRGAASKRAYALEMLDTMLPKDFRNYMLALLDELTPAQRIQRLKAHFPQADLTLEAHLQTLCAGESLGQDYWIRSCAIYTAAQLSLDSCADVIRKALAAPEPVVRQTAQQACLRLNLPVYAEVHSSPEQAAWPASSPEYEQKGTRLMYSIIEKVIILKTVNIFSETPDEALAEVAGILEEVEVGAGEQIIEKDEMGDSMYIIVNGRVRVHNGEVELNILKERDIFGEMAVLDAEPRSASVTALDDCLLFRLAQDDFYDLMADRIEITRGIVRVLSGHVRSRVRDVLELKNKVHELENRLQSPAQSGPGATPD